MLYVHKLKDLNPKTADIETMDIIRDIRRNVKFPLSPEIFKSYLKNCVFSMDDRQVMEDGLILVEPTIESVRKIMSRKDALHEPVNLQRAVQLLNSIPTGLAANITYTEEILSWWDQFIEEAVDVLNSIPKLKTREEKVAVNAKIGEMFKRILRQDGLQFNYGDIVNEAQTGTMKSLVESMQKGFFFHVTLEEELKKLDFNAIRARIPSASLKEVEDIESNLLMIKQGVDRAYSFNMAMVNCAVVLYSYVKLVNSGNL